MTPLPDLARLTELAPGLDAFIAEHLPLAHAARLRLARVDADGLALSAPLACNSNHHGTAFGGSLYVAGLAAAWGLVHLLQQLAGLNDAALVVGEARARYLRPVTQDFEAVATLPSPSAFSGFAQALRSGQKGELNVTARVFQSGKPAFELGCNFAARVPRPGGSSPA